MLGPLKEWPFWKWIRVLNDLSDGHMRLGILERVGSASPQAENPRKQRAVRDGRDYAKFGARLVGLTSEGDKPVEPVLRPHQDGRSFDMRKVRLKAPILKFTIQEALDNAFCARLAAVLRFWIDIS